MVRKQRKDSVVTYSEAREWRERAGPRVGLGTCLEEEVLDGGWACDRIRALD